MTPRTRDFLTGDPRKRGAYPSATGIDRQAASHAPLIFAERRIVPGSLEARTCHGRSYRLVPVRPGASIGHTDSWTLDTTAVRYKLAHGRYPRTWRERAEVPR